MGIPVVIALNMMDIVKKRGDSIDVNKLSKELGVPVLTEDEFLALLGGKAEDDPENGENGEQLGLFS